MALDDLLRDFELSGYCIVEGVIPADRCGEIRERVLAAVARQRLSTAPEKVGFVPSVINYEQSFAPYLADERLLALVGALLGEHVRISFTSAIVNEPGNQRGKWHADWPYNQQNAGHIPAPYPDAVMHLTTLWMISPFTDRNGGTYIVPGSHRERTNPTAAGWADPYQPLAGEMQVAGPIGSVVVMDSRMWHASSPNVSSEPRVALAVRYAPWWLNLEVLRPESDERKRMVEETGQTENVVPSVPREVFERLPENVKPLYRHWVSG